jgi:hypothetical protein
LPGAGNLALTANGATANLLGNFSKLSPSKGARLLSSLMKKFCRVLCVLIVTACVLRAADKDDEESPLGDFMPTFDDLIEYVPKFTVKLGFRALVGVKSSFGGQGVLNGNTAIGDATSINVDREYHDGYVRPDTQFTSGDISGPVPSTGTTNSWTYSNPAQYIEDGGYMTMHDYSITNTDTAFHSKNPGMSYGVELTAQRDFGKLFNTRMTWGVVGGMSVNQIFVHTEQDLAGELTTTTDYYSIGLHPGETPPPPPYSAPSSVGGTDTSVRLGNKVLFRDTQTTDATLTTGTTLRGAYVTLRAGPSIHVPITEKFSANFSAGLVLLYVGTTYDVTQEFLPETGDVMASATRDGESNVLPGYFADADVQYAMTDNSGVYVGSVFQSAGTYTQTVKSDDGLSRYTAKVDFGSMQALRAGFLFRF